MPGAVTESSPKKLLEQRIFRPTKSKTARSFHDQYGLQGKLQVLYQVCHPIVLLPALFFAQSDWF